MALILNRPCSLGREVGSHLARFTEVEVARLRAEGKSVPERCATCAFRAGTEPNGCLTTMADAFKALLEGDVFDCHEQPGPCAGWAILRRASHGGEPVQMPWEYQS